MTFQKILEKFGGRIEAYQALISGKLWEELKEGYPDITSGRGEDIPAGLLPERIQEEFRVEMARDLQLCRILLGKIVDELMAIRLRGTGRG